MHVLACTHAYNVTGHANMKIQNILSTYLVFLFFFLSFFFSFLLLLLYFKRVFSVVVNSSKKLFKAFTVNIWVCVCMCMRMLSNRNIYICMWLTIIHLNTVLLKTGEWQPKKEIFATKNQQKFSFISSFVFFCLQDLKILFYLKPDQTLNIKEF